MVSSPPSTQTRAIVEAEHPPTEPVAILASIEPSSPPSSTRSMISTAPHPLVLESGTTIDSSILAGFETFSSRSAVRRHPTIPPAVSMQTPSSRLIRRSSRSSPRSGFGRLALRTRPPQSPSSAAPLAHPPSSLAHELESQQPRAALPPPIPTRAPSSTPPPAHTLALAPDAAAPPIPNIVCDVNLAGPTNPGVGRPSTAATATPTPTPTPTTTNTTTTNTAAATNTATTATTSNTATTTTTTATTPHTTTAPTGTTPTAATSKTTMTGATPAAVAASAKTTDAANTTIPRSNSNPNNQPSLPINRFHRRAWRNRLVDVRFSLDQISIRPLSAAPQLLKLLSVYRSSQPSPCLDWSSVPLEGRLEVLLAIRCSASPEFYDYWTRQHTGLALFESWLKAAVLRINRRDLTRANGSHPDSSPDQTILLSILQILGKLTLTVDLLKKYTFGKQIFRINSELHAPKFSDDIQKLSKALEQKWRELARSYRPEVKTKPADVTLTTGSNPSSSNPSSSLLQPTAVDPPSAATNISHSTKPPQSNSFANYKPSASLPNNLTAASNLTTDPKPSLPHESRKRSETSTAEQAHLKKRKILVSAQPPSQPVVSGLFGRSEKPKLPSFKLPKSTVPKNVHNPFAEAMNLIKNRPVLPEGFDDSFASSLDRSTQKTQRKAGSKRVRFRSDNELCQIKLVERLVYEGPEYDAFPSNDALISDVEEGKYLHPINDLVEEEMEWEIPSEVILTSETILNLETSPLVSPAAKIQEEREQSHAEVRYDHESEIPENPYESDNVLQLTGDDEMERSNGPPLPRVMTLGRDVLSDPEVLRMMSHLEAESLIDEPVAADDAVFDLLSRLNADQPAYRTMSGPSEANHPSRVLVGADLNRASSNYGDLIQVDHPHLLPFSNHHHQSSSIESHPPASGPSTSSYKELSSSYQSGSDFHRFNSSNQFSTSYLDHSSSINTTHSSKEDFDHFDGDLNGPLSSAKKKRNRKKNKARFIRRSKAPCKWGSDCPYGQMCSFGHDDPVQPTTTTIPLPSTPWQQK